MALEGLKYNILASETLACAHDSTFDNDRHFSKSCFSSKIRSFSEQRSVFTKVFIYETYVHEMYKTFIWLPVSF